MNMHVEVDDLLAAYALDAVSAAEADLVRTHVVQCAGCATTLARLTSVTAALPLAVEQVAPPASLRSRLLAEVDGGARQPARLLQIPAARFDLRRRIADMRLRDLVSQPRRWAPAAAMAAVLAGLMVWNVNLQGQLGSPGKGASVAVSTGTLSDLHRTSQGTVTYIAADQVAVVSLRALHSPPAGRIYELWVIGRDNTPRPAGLFSPGADGTKLLLVPRALKPGDSIAVTDEPLAGSQAPTTAPFITGHI